MQAQIEHLKEVENNLRNALQNSESRKTFSKVDVEARIKQESSEIQQLSEKVLKTKNKKKQLKTENSSLREQISQMSEEVDQLRLDNETLKNEYSNISQTLQQEREQSKQMNDNQSKSFEDSRQLTENYESLLSEKQQLQDQLSKLQDEVENKSTLNKSLKSAIKESESQQQSIVESLRKQISDLKKQNNTLDMQLKKANNDTQILKEKAVDLSGTNQSIQEVKDAAAKQISDLEFENKELKLRVETQEKQLKDYQNIKKEFHEQQLLLDHIELERKNLSNILNIECDPIDGTWTNFIDKTTAAIDAQTIVKSVQDQNEKLKTRLKTTLETSSVTSTSAATKQNANEEEDQYVEALRSALEKAQKRNDEFETTIDELRYQKQFSYSIDTENASLIREISKLHIAIYPTEESMRGLILATIFARRLSKFRKDNTIRDIKALLCFKGRASKSPVSMIQSIRRRMSSLSQELVDTKKQLVSIIEEREELLTENNTLKVNLNTHTDELKLAKKRARFLKTRMIELQQELALHVPPEEYQNVCLMVKESGIKETELNNKIKEQEEIILNTTEELNKLKNEKELNEKRANQNADIANDMNEQILQKEKEMETLRILLSEKNKEILALERVVHRQKAIEKTATAAFANLALGEKSDISFDPKVETATLCNQEPSYSHNINPAFLN